MMANQFPRLPDPDYEMALKEAISGTFLYYRDHVILRKGKEFKWNDQWFSALSSVYVAIDHAIKSKSEIMGIKYWQISIVHNDGSETILSDKCKEQYLIGGSPWALFKSQQQ